MSRYCGVRPGVINAAPARWAPVGGPPGSRGCQSGGAAAVGPALTARCNGVARSGWWAPVSPPADSKARSRAAPPAGYRVDPGSDTRAVGVTGSFDGDAPVLLADQDKPIDQIKVGDEVQATDPDSGDTAAKRVTVLHRVHSGFHLRM